MSLFVPIIRICIALSDSEFIALTIQRDSSNFVMYFLIQKEIYVLHKLAKEACGCL